jgi:hypothetical protein
MLFEAIHTPHCYPPITEDALPILDIPSHRIPLIRRLETVTRYKFMIPGTDNDPQYYPVRIIDDGLAHTMRTAKKPFLLPNFSRGAQIHISDMLQIHDAPEYGKPHDMTTIEKYKNPKLAGKVALEELTRAQEMFTPEDFALYLEYEKAKPILENKVDLTDETTATPEAIIAKIIDVVDGDMNFHIWASQIIEREGLFRWNGSPLDSFAFAFKRRKEYLDRLQELQLPNEFHQTAVGLFNEMAQFIAACWIDIPQRDIHPEFQVELAKSA